MMFFKAIRIGSELNLHRCITKMPHSKQDCYERTRLYFLVYIVDHHSSLTHGRPPMTRELPSSNAPRTLLQGRFSTVKDLSLVSQMELWSTSSRVFDVFGADIEGILDPLKSMELRRLANAFEEWHAEWLEILTVRDMTERFYQLSQYMCTLYYSSAKLYLFSHAFRGPAQRDLTPPVAITSGLDDIAQRAVEEAFSIIRSVLASPESNRSTPGDLPCYFTTVTAFASVVLLRASSQTQSHYVADRKEVLQTLHQLIDFVQGRLFGPDISIHPLLGIANSLKVAVDSISEANPNSIAGNGINQAIEFSSLDFDLFGQDLFGFGFADNHSPMDWLSFPSPVGPNRVHSRIFEGYEKI